MKDTLFDRGIGYQAALQDIKEALQLADHARRTGIVTDFELVVRSELSLRWHKRIDDGELPKTSFSPETVILLAQAAGTLMQEEVPAEIL